MNKYKVVHGPVIQTNSRMIYSITLLSGHIITSPDGFIAEDVFSTNNVDDNNLPRIKENTEDVNKQEITV
jgi:hypothetical protein